MSQFHIRSKLDALGGRDVSVDDKDHVGDGSPGEYGATDKLADEIDARVLVRNCHDDADRYEHNATYPQSEQQAIPG